MNIPVREHMLDPLKCRRLSLPRVEVRGRVESTTVSEDRAAYCHYY